MAWDALCRPKSVGGLGFRNVMLWNIAFIGKYVWAVATKLDSVWLKWINSVYLKNSSWWTYTPPLSASWYWEKVCNVKERLKLLYTEQEMRQMTSYSVKAVYEKLCIEFTDVQWDVVVWNRLSVPRHRFIMWLVVQGRLQTTARLARCGISSYDLCQSCAYGPETHQHLFFTCPYSEACLK